VSGVVVTAYDSSGTQVGTATTSGDGTYSLNVSSAATNNVRIEFTTPNGYQPSFQGAANATSIQFVSIPATNGVQDISEERFFQSLIPMDYL
jgi:hypothetical protein